MKSLRECFCMIKKLDKKQITICVGLLALLAGLGLFTVWLSDDTAEQDKKAECEVQFSVPSGFYEEGVSLRLSAPQNGEILYTLNGSIPGRDNEESLVYAPDEGILLTCDVEEKIYTVRAVLIQEDSKRPTGTMGLTDPVEPVVSTASYCIGSRVKERYEIPVLVIAGAPEDLSDEETGILSLKNRDLRGSEAEKAVQITLFDEQGNIMFSQNGGVRIHGGKSRGKNQPSLRLYARSEYDEENRFDCLLLQDYSMDNTLMTGYKRVIVRNGGNDHGYAHLRSEYASRLIQDTGFPDVQGASPVCVYINGEYYGVHWFVTAYDRTYFEKKYGEFEGEMVVLEGIVAYMEPDEEDGELTLEMKEEYNALHQQVAYEDLSVEANWQLLNASIDVENYLQYVAIQNYLCNADAFQNNFKTFRYYSSEGKYREGTVFDGRYRFMFYDLDETLGFGTYDTNLAEANILTTTNRLDYEIFYNALFSNIVSVRECRDLYIRYYLALLNYYFSEKRVVPVLDEMHESHAAELRYQYSETDLMRDNPDTPENVDYSHVITELDEIKAFLKNRPGWALIDLEEAFGLNSQYSIAILNPGEANISVDYATFHDKEYTGIYYAEVPTTVTASPKCGDKFDYWLVDGVEYYDRTLTITGDMLRDDVLYMECVTSPDPDAGLLISAVKSRGGSDYIVLTNYGSRSLDLADYTLADGAADRNISPLPSVEVAAGEEIIVYCKSYKGAEAIGRPEAGFNIKEGETLHLYCRGRLLQKVAIPKLGTRDGIYRINIYNGKFYEKLE